MQVGGMVEGISRSFHGPQYMAGGGSVVAAAAPGMQDFGTLNLAAPNGATAQVVVDKKMARDLLQIINQMGWRATA